ncbi:hypothetical protein OROMI_018918 [Orobanche minor]
MRSGQLCSPVCRRWRLRFAGEGRVARGKKGCRLGGFLFTSAWTGVIQHDQGLAEEADNSMQEVDQDYLDSGRSHGRIQFKRKFETSCLDLGPKLSISKFFTGVPVGDIEVREASIGAIEVLSILKASLTSTSVLTNCLKKVIMEPKAEPST